MFFRVTIKKYPEGEEIDKFKSRHNAKAQEEAQNSSNCCQPAEPILIHVHSISRWYEILEKYMNQGFVSEIDVLAVKKSSGYFQSCIIYPN